MIIEYIGHIKNDDKLYDSSGIIICGAGKMVNRMLHRLTEMKLIGRVKAIADNDASKYNQFVDGIVVSPYADIVRAYSEFSYVVYNDYAKDIFEQLIKDDVKHIHLIREL